MLRTTVLGIGSHVPERVVTNDEMPFLNQRRERCATPQIETSDEWIQQRSGIRQRHYAGSEARCSDLALAASRAALADAGASAEQIDCIIVATLSPDIHFPGVGVFLQHKLGITAGTCACYDIRQQCSGFVYGLQMADAFVRTGLYKRILLVGSEIHSHLLDFSTRGRAITVLFGDGAGAFVLGPMETNDARAGVIHTEAHADGSGAWDLYMRSLVRTRELPFLHFDEADADVGPQLYPQMDGRKVFKSAVRRMAECAIGALQKTGLGWDAIDWFVPHQANLRINQAVAEVAHIPPDKVLNTIELYGNTTAATVPLTIDHWRKHGKVKRGDRVLSVVFGSGDTWGAAIFQV